MTAVEDLIGKCKVSIIKEIGPKDILVFSIPDSLGNDEIIFLKSELGRLYEELNIKSLMFTDIYKVQIWREDDDKTNNNE